MQIPGKLEALLQEEAGIRGHILTSMSNLEEWVKHSKVPFFPEFTDHGPDHIKAVLETTQWLIRDDSWPLLTASDAAVLCSAVFLHDAAMHLTEDGFLRLIRSNTCGTANTGFAEKPWASLWEDFIAEATRFDGRKLNAVFGSTEPVRRPHRDPVKWTYRDRLLIGEFVRRNHARIAHEIATDGVPGPADSKIIVGLADKQLAELSGVVARSHGLPLRDCIDYLVKQYDHNRTPVFAGVHPVFLMVLLRIADYLQIESSRTPRAVLQTWRLRSPVSQKEWNLHLSICSVSHIDKDPEAVHVTALPEDVTTFLRVKDWLCDIQTELDESWAVLGEEYGRYEELRRLGMRIRRVRSNLDNHEEFARRVSYFPCRAVIDSAGADLLKLLIEPLYGNRPAFAARELVQNAVDAVRELRAVVPDASERQKLDVPKQEADVLVTLARDRNHKWWFTVSDAGIGMTVDAVRNYFLTAGACIRQSDAWRQHFLDRKGHSTVLRTGRFGIGVLTAFLLGKTVHVTTRHYDSPQGDGIQFSASMDSELIELRRIERPIGTTVRIEVGDHVASVLLKNLDSWDWYCLNDPSVKRTVEGKTRPKQRYHLPSNTEQLPSHFRRIRFSGLADVHWTHAAAPRLTCNGLIVKEEGEQAIVAVHQALEGLDLLLPGISVFDPDGKMPLTLDRTEIADPEYPLEKMIVKSVLRDFLAYAIVHAPHTPMNEAEGLAPFYACPYPGRTKQFRVGAQLAIWLTTSDGTYLTDEWLLQQTGLRQLVIMTALSPYSSAPSFQVSRQCAVLNATVSLDDRTGQGLAWDFWENRTDQLKNGFLSAFAIAGYRIIVTRSVDEYMRNVERPGADLVVEVREGMKTAVSPIVYRCMRCPPMMTVDLESLCRTIRSFDSLWSGLIVELYLGKSRGDVTPSPVGQLWSDLIGNQPIPYNPADRKRRLPKAFRTLKDSWLAHAAIAGEAARGRKSGKPRTGLRTATG